MRNREPDRSPMSETENLAPDEHARNRGIIEALLIASDLPVGAAKIAAVLDRVETREIRTYVDDLNTEYGTTGRSFKITEVAGGYQMMVHPEYATWVRRLLREKSPARLSPAALETLAIVAFKQPIIKAEIEHIRGVSADGVIRHLMEKGLVRISGRSDSPGRPLLYGTTRDFLKHFGMKTLSDLPKMRELEELLQEEEAKGDEGSLLGDLFRPEEKDSVDEDGETGAPESVSSPGGSGVAEGERQTDSDGQNPG